MSPAMLVSRSNHFFGLVTRLIIAGNPLQQSQKIRKDKNQEKNPLYSCLSYPKNHYSCTKRLIRLLHTFTRCSNVSQFR